VIRAFRFGVAAAFASAQSAKPENQGDIMKRRLALISIVAAAAAQPVLAQESAEATATAVRRPSGPPERAWEIGVGLGYSQAVGDIGSNSPSLTDITHGGGELQLNAGYRINPKWLVGLYGTAGKYSLGNLTPDDSDVWSVTAGAQANYHLMPEEQWDPWIGLGAGWRGHWISKPVGTDTRHGLDLARLQVGVDYRVSPEFSISPYVGATATMFLTEQIAQQTTFSNVHDPNVNFFFFGGLMGRFDIMGRNAPDRRVASN
jgi:outer membrane protein with beta-barrel domain